MHEQEITPAGFISVEDMDLDYIEEDHKVSLCDIECHVSFENVHPGTSDSPTPFIMASFDIECTSSDGTFPQAQRQNDKIIQIFTTFYKYGENEPYYTHACVLGETENIEGVDMECFYEGKQYNKDDEKYFQNAHTFHFTLESLENLMAKHGIELIHGNQFVRSAFRHTNIKTS